MPLLYGFFIALFGATIGSFANVVILRMKSGEGFGGRSHCLFCKKTLLARDLIPIWSWVSLKGKCRYCRKRIHWQYPAVESVMAVLSLIAFLRHADQGLIGLAQTGFEIGLAFVLVVITAYDIRWKLIPMDFLLAGTVVLSAFRILLGASWVSLSIGALVAAGFLGAFVLFSRGRMMGEGDPFVGLMMGAVLGFPLILAGLLSAFVIGGIFATVLLAAGWVKRNTRVPLVPFLALGTLVALWFGDLMISLMWYG